MPTGTKPRKGRGTGRKVAAAKSKRTRPKPPRGRSIKPGDCFKAAAAGRSGGGLGVLAAVIEGDGADWDIAQVMHDKTVANGAPAKKGGRAAAEKKQRAGGSRKGGPGGGGGVSQIDLRRAVRALTGKRTLAALSNIFAALGNEHRVAILVKLLEGSAGYHELQKHTGLGAGPLYHHVAQLRLAGLILPKSRDVYEMTRGGRNVLLLALAAAALGTDKRRRPTAGGVAR